MLLNYYIKIPLNNNIFLSIENIQSILQLSNKISIFYIIPKLDENNNQIKFTYSITLLNTNLETADYINLNSNHCQNGSDIVISTFAICKDIKTCVKTFMPELTNKKRHKIYIPTPFVILNDSVGSIYSNHPEPNIKDDIN